MNGIADKYRKIPTNMVKFILERDGTNFDISQLVVLY